MTSGARLLRSWCVRHGVTSAEFARRVNEATKRVSRVTPRKRPPYHSVRMWLSGRWTPQLHWRDCIEEVTEGAVTHADWQDEVES